MAASISPPFFFRKNSSSKDFTERKKLHDLFKSCEIAYTELKAESGLLALHLAKTPLFEKKVQLKDGLGRKYLIEIDHYPFILQKKASLIFPTLEEYLAKGNIEEAKKALSEILHLISTRYEKGIVDNELF